MGDEELLIGDVTLLMSGEAELLRGESGDIELLSGDNSPPLAAAGAFPNTSVTIDDVPASIFPPLLAPNPLGTTSPTTILLLLEDPVAHGNSFTSDPIS